MTPKGLQLHSVRGMPAQCPQYLPISDWMPAIDGVMMNGDPYRTTPINQISVAVYSLPTCPRALTQLMRAQIGDCEQQFQSGSQRARPPTIRMRDACALEHLTPGSLITSPCTLPASGARSAWRLLSDDLVTHFALTCPLLACLKTPPLKQRKCHRCFGRPVFI